MADRKARFIVTEKPKWYYKSSYKDVFACESTQGLFNSVANLMLRKQDKLSESEHRRKPKNIHKTIRDKVLQNAKCLRQKPSVELLRALMDLVDVEGGNGFDCIENVDKVGMKHVLIASGNYTAFYLPQKELSNPNGTKKVIPVVTQCSETRNLILHDISRSMIGTYIVDMLQNGEDCGKTYFLQEVLFVPGHESLELLKVVTSDKYEFWDMALEVPTDLTALMPCFQQIHPSQLLQSEVTLDTQNNSEALDSHIDPMCCVVGADVAETMKSKREKNPDCIQAEHVRFNLTHFHYENGGTPTVFYKRNSRSVEGKKAYLVSVVNLRQGQDDIPGLYVSTTVRFCRAVKRSCFKGNGELVSSWNETIQDLDRDTFILGREMHQEIYNPALTAFIKRVNPNSWCNYTPKHIESTIGDPGEVEVVDLAIKFMDSKIPNAFAVAELLHCPMKKVQEYQSFWNLYNSDRQIATAVKKKHYNMIEAQMAMDWTELSHIASSYGQIRYPGDVKMVSACNALYKDCAMDNAAKAQKMWHSLIKPHVHKDKTLTQLYSKAKVLFIKLRTKYKRVKKGLKLRGEHAEEVVDTDGPSNHVTKGKKLNKVKISVQSSLYSIAIPEAVPIWTWIKNMSTLLMSEPWLNGEHLRREAVCTLLALDNTLLHSRHSVILKEWVINNRPVVHVLKSHSLQDRLSKALVDCLASTSTENWKCNILTSFHGAPSQSMGLSAQTTHYIKTNPGGFRGKRCGQDKNLHHTTALKQDRTYERNKQSTCKSMQNYEEQDSEIVDAASEEEEDEGTSEDSTSKPFRIKVNKKAEAHGSQIHNQYTRYQDHVLCEAVEVSGDEEECDTESEYEIWGEDLDATMHRDNIESPDEYDPNDKFIDNRPIDEDSSNEDGSSDEEADEKAFCAQHQRRRAVRRHKRVSHSESEEDYYRQPGGIGDTEADTGAYKRTLSSSSDEELIKPTVKRPKCVTERRVKEKLIRAENKTSVPRPKRKEETRNRQEGSKRCKAVKLNKNTHAKKQDSPLYKNKLSDLETYDPESHWGGINVDIKCHPSPVTQARQEERRSHSKTQKARPHNSTRQKCETIEQNRPQESLHNYPVSTASRQSPDDTQSQVPRLHGEATEFAYLTKQASWPSDTLESDHEDLCDPEEERIESEDNSNRTNESTSEDEDLSDHTDKSTSEDEDHSNHPDTNPSEDEDSDLGHNRMDTKPDKTGCGETSTDSDYNNCVRVHM